MIRLPKVPGAKGKYPAKKRVQINLAKSLFFKVVFLCLSYFMEVLTYLSTPFSKNAFLTR